MGSRTAALAVLLALLGAVPASAADLVVPAHDQQRGTIMFLHGGAWMGGSPSSELIHARTFAAHGWRGISVDYPLGDIAAAYRSVEDHAKRLAASGPLVAIGESAGGTMAEWLAARREVDAAVAVDAPANLVTWRAVRPDGALAWLPLTVRGFAQNSWPLSPVRSYRAASAAPLLVIGAQDDQLVEREQLVAMQALGAELAWTPGDHLISRRWRRPAAAFLRRVTRR